MTIEQTETRLAELRKARKATAPRSKDRAAIDRQIIAIYNASHAALGL